MINRILYRRPIFQSTETGLEANFFQQIAHSINGMLGQGQLYFSSGCNLAPHAAKVTTDTEQYKTIIHTSPNAFVIIVHLLIQADTNSSSIQFLSDTSVSLPKGPGEITPHIDNSIYELRMEHTIDTMDQDQDIEIYLMTGSEFTIRSICIYDEPKRLTSTDEGWIDVTDWYKGKELGYSVLRNLVNGQKSCDAYLRKTHVHSVCDNATQCLFSGLSTADFTNIDDPTYSGFAWESPGFFIRPGASQFGTNTVDLDCSLFCSATDTDQEIRFVDRNHISPAIVPTTSPAWHTVELQTDTPWDYSEQYCDKIDIVIKGTTAQTIKIWNIIVKEKSPHYDD